MNLEPIYKKLDKLQSPEEIVKAYNDIKQFLTGKLTKLQQEKEEEANNIQQQIDNLK